MFISDLYMTIGVFFNTIWGKFRAEKTPYKGKRKGDFLN